MEWWKDVKITKLVICGIKPFNGEYMFSFAANKCLLTGRNGSGKTVLLKAIEFFFNENKYFKTFSPNDFNLEKPFIMIEFQVGESLVQVKKILKLSKTAITINKTEYSTSKFDIKITNFIDTVFVYYFSSNRLLTEKDNEFDFVKNSILNYLNYQTSEKQDLLDKNIREAIDVYKKMYLCEFDQELDFDYTLNLRTGIKFKLVWKDSPFDTLGNGERKQRALRVLYSYINSRKKGPSVLLIDSIENHFDLQMLLSTLQTIRSLPTILQVISTFSKKVLEVLDEYAFSIVNKGMTSNYYEEIWGFLHQNGIVF